MSRNRIALVVLASAVALSAPVLAAEPSRHEIYEAATTGHLDQAQKMIDQVLKDHPTSAEAHYIAAEVYAREGNFGVARTQLAQAEQIDPSDAFAKPEAVRALKAELAGSPARAATGGGYLAPVRSEPTHSFPFFPVLLLVGLIAIVWMVVRRRSAPAVYSGYPAAAGPGAPYAAGPGYGPGYGPTPMGGGGIGSGIAGGLASGLAVGAVWLPVKSWRITSSTVASGASSSSRRPSRWRPRRMATWAARILVRPGRTVGTTPAPAAGISVAAVVETIGPD